jgi:hypothetical protein
MRSAEEIGNWPGPGRAVSCEAQRDLAVRCGLAMLQRMFPTSTESVDEGLHDGLRRRPSSLIISFGCSSISTASLSSGPCTSSRCKDGGVLEFNAMAQVDAVFGHG